MSPFSPSSKSTTSSSARSDTESPENSADPHSQTLDDAYDDNLELAAETEEDSVALTLRYLGNAVAWITATDFLFSSPRIRRTPRLRLHLAITPPPVDPKAMANAAEIFMGIFNKFLEDQEDWSKARISIACTWSTEFAKRVEKYGAFCGKVHCEASLMGAIVQYQGQADTKGNMQNTQLLEIFHVSFVCLTPWWHAANHSF